MKHIPYALLALLLLMVACTGGRRQAEFREALLRARAQNQSYQTVENDTLLRQVADFYDHHGTPNERMEAHYLLGCAYRDKGQSPMAVDCYQEAIARADTTAADCDYRLLSAVYSQMARQYHRQLLFSYEIDARRLSEHYAYRGGDTLNAIFERKIIAGVYTMLHKTDSAEIDLKKVLQDYRDYGYIQDGIKASTMLMHIYKDQPEKWAELSRLVKDYDAQCDLFDKHHELPPGKRLFYYYKGCSFEQSNQLDSAEYYYRKTAYPAMPLSVQNSMYKGLLSVFRKRHISDSVAKYAELYCAVNDSSIVLKDQELTVQMAACYNYTFFQKEAREKEREVFVTRVVFFICCVVAVCIAFFAYRFIQRVIRRLRDEREKMKTEYLQKENLMQQEYERDLQELMFQQEKKQQELESVRRTADEYRKKLRQLQLLEETHKKLAATLQAELCDAKGRSDRYRKKTEQRLTEYEAKKAELTEEISRLRQEVERLRLKDDVSSHIDSSNAFAEKDIVKRVKFAAEHPLVQLTEKEWTSLSEVFGQNYPQFFHDISPWLSKPVRIRICLLSALGIRNGEQAALLNATKQTVTNNMAAINLHLFGEETSKTLYANLVKRYKIYI